MNYREIFLTAVVVSGLVTLLFTTAPQPDQGSHLEAGRPVVRTVSMKAG